MSLAPSRLHRRREGQREKEQLTSKSQLELTSTSAEILGKAIRLLSQLRHRISRPVTCLRSSKRECRGSVTVADSSPYASAASETRQSKATILMPSSREKSRLWGVSCVPEPTLDIPNRYDMRDSKETLGGLTVGSTSYKFEYLTRRRTGNLAGRPVGIAHEFLVLRGWAARSCLAQTVVC